MRKRKRQILHVKEKSVPFNSVCYLKQKKKKWSIKSMQPKSRGAQTAAQLGEPGRRRGGQAKAASEAGVPESDPESDPAAWTMVLSPRNKAPQTWESASG